MEKVSDISLHVLTSDDFDDVMQLMRRTFYAREVVTNVVGCSDDVMDAMTTAVIQNDLENGVCFGLRDLKTKKLIAVKICSILTRDTHHPLEPVKPETFKQKAILAVAQSVPPPESLFDDPNIEKILYGRFSNVDPDYTRRGLSNILHEACERAGIEKGCQVFYSQVGDKALLGNMINKGCHVLQSTKINEISLDGQPVIPKSDSSDFSISALVKILIPGTYKFKSSL
ncbi:uncharacterized protein [Palaemon carinicauda]|uniref:uncharacterized protein n=1 Tax=Palaemon carinicauda TaxID=392227 RepID=UPI0035B66949